MARRKKKPQPTTAKRVEKPMVIHIDPWKIPTGHRVKWCGSGLHADKRTRRKRTRGDQKRQAIDESGSPVTLRVTGEPLSTDTK
jgi:hypothetical protein